MDKTTLIDIGGGRITGDRRQDRTKNKGRRTRGGDLDVLTSNDTPDRKLCLSERWQGSFHDRWHMRGGEVGDAQCAAADFNGDGKIRQAS
jgi:hypothetical protein